MKPERTEGGFTIIELLTVMSIIIVLISLLAPALNRVRKVAKDLSQKSQFYDIEKALAQFRSDHEDEYPNSDGNDPDPSGTVPYCGAMKLCEAVAGQDGMGFHNESRFWAGGGPAQDGGADSDNYPLYPFNLCASVSPPYIGAQASTLRKRQLYLENRNIKICRLEAMYPRTISPFVEGEVVVPNAVICDVYMRASVENTCTAMAGQKVGMPVLYYKADVRKLAHDPCTIDLDIYNVEDNQYLVGLGLPWENPIVTVPRLYDSPVRRTNFYELTRNPSVTSTPTPYKKDEFILISAGYDGEFGTRDDIFNFERR